MTEQRRETVLVVEDDPGVAHLERRRLERAGYAVLTAATAEEALGQLGQNAVDLILLDYRLPGDVDGLDFYAQVREAGHDLPVILVTGYSNEATVIKALRAGVRDFVTKSVEYLDYLPEAVGRVLRQVRTENQLAESESRLAAIIDSAQDAILIADAGQRISLFNKAAEAMFRCPAAQALGQPVSRFIPGEHEAASEGVNGVPKSLADAGRFEACGVRAGGETFPLEASAARTQVGGRVFHTLMVRDVTERRRLEEQFRQAQKMEAVGRLAGGVAHDFNNLLCVILGYSGAVFDGLPADDRLRGMVDEVRKAGERAASLTRQLLAFSRQQALQPKVLDLNAVVCDTEKMLARLIGEDVRLASVLDPALGRVLADPGQVEQILMNLAVNARDAMPRGGQLTLETANVELDGSNARVRPEVRPGRYVMLAVSDTGCGMDEATKARIFEPFFTTKGVGKGTGLGLATVYGIVKQSGGCIFVYSEPGRGTTFKVYLPRAEAVAPSRKSHPGASRSAGGGETVLLVEDERAVRTLAGEVLRSKGYTALEAADGGEALRCAERHRGPIHLLVTDVVMPEVGGRDLADRMTAVRPELRVLYLSGYTDDSVVRHGVLEADVAFLQKPFTPDGLARKVREVLDR